jgi:hypothetical protein
VIVFFTFSDKKKGRRNPEYPVVKENAYRPLPGTCTYDRESRAALSPGALQATVYLGDVLDPVISFGIITANTKLFEDFFYIHHGMTRPVVIAGALLRYYLLYNRSLR